MGFLSRKRLSFYFSILASGSPYFGGGFLFDYKWRNAAYFTFFCFYPSTAYWVILDHLDYFNLITILNTTNWRFYLVCP